MNPKPCLFRKHTHHQPRGFTLVELLVVITIIIVLVSIGFPLVTNMRNKANRTQCVTQLRTWGVAMGGYAADNDGRLNWEHWPSIGNDPLTYSPYVSYWTGDSEDRSGFAMQLKQRCCPAVKWNSRASNSPVTYTTIQPVGVTKVRITGRINGLSSDYPLSRIKNNARFMLMIDAVSSRSYSISTREDFIARVKPLTLRGPNLRHANSVNALFADYSVREMSWNEIEKGLKYWTTF